MEHSAETRKNIIRKQTGFSLIETLIAMVLLSTMGVGVLAFLSTASRTLALRDERGVAQSLAISQMEYVQSQIYVPGPTPQYTLIPDVPAGYGMAVAVNSLDPKGDGLSKDDGIQEIIVTVSRNDRQVLKLTGRKLNPWQ